MCLDLAFHAPKLLLPTPRARAFLLFLILYVAQKLLEKQIKIFFITREQLTDVNNRSETPPYIIMH